MLDWFRHKGWTLPLSDHCHVLQNVCSHLKRSVKAGVVAAGPANEIVFFGRHEERKGLVPFCDAIDLVASDLERRGVQVTFLGGFGALNGESSAVYLASRASSWHFPISVLPDFDRTQAAGYLAKNPGSVVVIPSPEENSPYTVLEALALGKPLITSAAGGARELLHPDIADVLTCDITTGELARKLTQAITSGLPPSRPAFRFEETEQLWVRFHETIRPEPLSPSRSSGRKLSRKQTSARAAPEKPKVVAAITHHERPAKLVDAVLSLATQNYDRLEIVIVDDGSSHPATLAAIERIQPLLDKLGVRLITQQNLYLGAARNRAAQETQSEYLLFLDDDDIAFPYLVQTLVTAAEATGADIVNCLNPYMPESRRHESHPFPDRFDQKVFYVPMGGPLSLAPLENCFGASTALIRRASLQALNGYTEQFGVGYEDFELYARALQAGLRIEICPIPLYLYEVDRPSMASRTSRMCNTRRVVQALDFQAGEPAWRDLISVHAGNTAAAHATNLANYNRRLSPHANLLERIAAADTTTPEFPALVAELASGLGAVTFARTMLALAAQRVQAVQPGSALPNLPPLLRDMRPSVPVQTLDDVPLLLALGDLAHGRISEAATALQLALERRPGELSDLHIRLLRDLGARPDLEADLAAPLLATLSRMSMTIDHFRAVAPSLFCMAILAADSATAVAVIDRTLSIEDEAYLANNLDVAEVVRDGGYNDGLAHFADNGAKEGRPGFTILGQIAAVAEALSGAKIPLLTLREFPARRVNGNASFSTSVLPPPVTPARETRSEIRLPVTALPIHTAV